MEERVTHLVKQVLTFYDNSNFVFFFSFKKKRTLGFINFFFVFFCFYSILCPAFPPLFPAFPPWFSAFPPWFPTFPRWFPAFSPPFPGFPPHSPHSHLDSPRSHPDSPRSHHSPHSVLRFPIPAFTDSLFLLASYDVLHYDIELVNLSFSNTPVFFYLIFLMNVP